MFGRLYQDQRPAATAHLTQTMAFLEMSTAALDDVLQKELDENPALEAVDELRCPQCGRRVHTLPCPACLRQAADSLALVYVTPRDGGLFGREMRCCDDDDLPEPGAPERLDEYILRQIGPALQPDERQIARYILDRLDDHGLLPESAGEVAGYLHQPLERVEHVLGLIQRADPPGVACRTPQDCLLIQLETLAEAAPAATLTLAHAILAAHFDLLARGEHGRIARQLHVSRGAVEIAARFISDSLTPYPASTYWGDGRNRAPDSNALLNPDVTIGRLPGQSHGPLMVEVYAPLSGWLRVNPDLKKALSDCNAEQRVKWAPAIERATLVAKCIQQRNNTMRRLMEILAAEQRDYILGSDADLKPLTRSEVADRLQLHESTISRAVADKSAALPDGRVVPLSRFFDRSLWIRDRVRQMVENETRALTDDEIAARLAEDGIHVARRTVAKYRGMLGILPAAVRSRLARPPRLRSGPAGKRPAARPRLAAGVAV